MQNALLLISALLVGTAFAGDFITFNYGGRANKLFIPSGGNSAKQNSLKLYVMLHGCTQDPTDFAAGTKMNEYGEKYNSFVLYPLQPSSANMNKCWNWFEPKDQQRAAGEAGLIADMTKEVISKYTTINPQTVYLGGLSAGGAMTTIVGVLYPDIFAAICVGAGLEWKAATSMTAALLAMNMGGPDPTKQGEDAYHAEGRYNRTQGVMVVHGTSDHTVAFINGEQVITQYAKTLDLVIGRGYSKGVITDVPTYQEKGQVPGGRSYTVNNYVDASTGKVLMKFVIVDSMAHAWSGGSSSGTYTDPSGPDASLMMIEFFSNFPNGTASTTGPITTGSSSTTSSSTTGSTTGTTGSIDYHNMKFYAVPDESGYVGQLVVDGYGTDVAKIGDKGMYNTDTYRTILSFDTSSLPQGAIIKRATLRIYRKSLQGSVSSISVDINAGPFNSYNALERSDYSAPASAVNVAHLSVPSSDNSFTEVELPSSALQYIRYENANGRTAFRLRATTTASFSANTLFIWGGRDESAYAPLLSVDIA